MSTTSPTIIDQQYLNGNSLIDYLKVQRELTFYNEAENNFRKTILLSAASYFEKEFTDLIIEFAKSQSDGNDLVISIIKQKAISRQYHTYFNWESSNANTFFGLFGTDFQTKMKQRVKEEPALDKSIKAFLGIGNERNKMVHQNFAEITIDKTAEEIYTLYQTSLLFIETMKSELIKKKTP
ncbi:HEPN domain-containing protein [Flavobacterium chungangense]|uniref:RiboL-PSP-HEPN domain-containing protein n=1 Tax=Flavobacterium chungangense TaxID=554283 RepID=A0A6V6ZE95_9FLAO|nr:HEPN domain-containing protein [Flavobacterium chungangense]CAD0009989.1 hypothetical protein FLACHUCJ7_04629 [Flavobacterium chungangense]